MKRLEETLIVDKEYAKIINHYCEVEPADESECLGEDETISETVVFEDGAEMDIKCCGVQYQEGEINRAWTEAVLFKNGCQVACSEPSDGYFGEWELEADGVLYVANVKESE